jgi:hypothetical protein
VIERNRRLFNWRSLGAIVTGLAIYYAPFAISSRLEGSHKGLQMVMRENVVRYFRPFDHRGPIYLYVYVIFALMAPWAMLLPAALADAHRRHLSGDECRRSDRFVLAFFWTTFIFFTLSGSRRSYYILPILPAAAILIARMLTRDGPLPVLARRLLALGYGLIVVMVIVSIAVLLPPHLLLRGSLATLPSAPDRALFATVWLASMAGVVCALRDYRPSRVAISTALTAYLAMGYVNIFAMPAAEAYRGEKTFALQAAVLLHGDTSTLGFYKTLGGLFYLNPPRPIFKTDNLPDLHAAIRKAGLRWILTHRRDLAEIDMPARVRLEEASFPWEDAQQIRAKGVLIELLSPEPPR